MLSRGVPVPTITLTALTAMLEKASPEERAALARVLEVAPAQASAADNFRTKAQREAGDGFACTAPEPCSRHDLRTTKNAASHVLPNGHVAR